MRFLQRQKGRAPAPNPHLGLHLETPSGRRGFGVALISRTKALDRKQTPWMHILGPPTGRHHPPAPPNPRCASTRTVVRANRTTPTIRLAPCTRSTNITPTTRERTAARAAGTGRDLKKLPLNRPPWDEAGDLPRTVLTAPEQADHSPPTYQVGKQGPGPTGK